MEHASESFDQAVQLLQAGHLLEAEEIGKRLVAAEAGYGDAWHLLGVIALQMGNHELGADRLHRAVVANPADAEAFNNLGVALKNQSLWDEAIDRFRQAVKLRPNFCEAYFNLGNALQEQARPEEAIACYRQALSLKPGAPEIHVTLGLAFHTQRKFAEAIASYRQAVALLPTSAETFNYLGAACQGNGMLDEALAAYGHAIALDPSYAAAHHNVGTVLKDRGQVDQAIGTFRRALEIAPNDSRIHSNLLFTLLYHPESTPAALHEESRNWNRQHAEPLRKLIRPHTNDANLGRRLRVGYVAPDCHALYMVPLLSSHNRADFELFCYTTSDSTDSITERLRTGTDVWRNVARLSDEQLAEMVRADRIDILVDLTMHTAGSRLLMFARKPAPVQVCWLAYPGTTGLSTMDFRLTDPYLDPPGLDDRFYSEESIRLPETFWCYDPLTGDSAVTPCPAFQNGIITFGCLSNLCKLNDAVLKLWAQVLRSVEKSRLMLLAAEGSCRQRMIELLEQEGVSASRIVFVAQRPRAQYLGLYQQIDIVLDTLPYNGHTTSLDSVWMGVPVVTLVGQTVVGRGGFSQLMNLGVPELIARTPDEFVQIVRELAGDLPRLSELRRTLRKRLQASPLMDAPRFARNMETAYRQMWQAWCAKTK